MTWTRWWRTGGGRGRHCGARGVARRATERRSALGDELAAAVRASDARLEAAAEAESSGTDARLREVEHALRAGETALGHRVKEVRKMEEAIRLALSHLEGVSERVSHATKRAPSGAPSRNDVLREQLVLSGVVEKHDGAVRLLSNPPREWLDLDAEEEDDAAAAAAARRAAAGGAAGGYHAQCGKGRRRRRGRAAGGWAGGARRWASRQPAGQLTEEELSMLRARRCRRSSSTATPMSSTAERRGQADAAGSLAARLREAYAHRTR